MADIQISGTTFQAYSSIAEADAYLVADAGLGAAWIARDANEKNVALVSATRYLQALKWTAGEAPAFTDIPEQVRDVNSILAAMVASDPSLLNGASEGSNIRRVQAGSAQVEFFGPTSSRPLPLRLSRLLGALLRSGGSSGSGRIGIPFDASDGADRSTDSEEFGLSGSLG